MPKNAYCLRFRTYGPCRRDKLFRAQTTFHLFQHFPLQLKQRGPPSQTARNSDIAFWGGLLCTLRGGRQLGPYRLIRHPRYAGYTLPHVGFLLAMPSVFNVAVYALSLILQLVRISREVLVRDPACVAIAECVRYRLLPTRVEDEMDTGRPFDSLASPLGRRRGAAGRIVVGRRQSYETPRISDLPARALCSPLARCRPSPRHSSPRRRDAVGRNRRSKRCCDENRAVHLPYSLGSQSPHPG